MDRERQMDGFSSSVRAFPVVVLVHLATYSRGCCFFYFNQLPCSHEGTESKRVRESKNSTSLGIYLQRPMHSVSVLPFKHEQLNASETFEVCLVGDFFQL